MHGVRNVMPRPALGPPIVLEVLGVVRMSPREGTQYGLSIARDAQVTGVGLLCVCSYLLYLMHGVRNVMPRPALVPSIVLEVLGVVRMSPREGTQYGLSIARDAQVTGVGLLCVCSYLVYLMHGVRNVMPRPALGPPIVLEVLGVVRMSPREGTQYGLSIARDAQVTGVGLLCVCSYLLYLMHGVRNVMPRPALGPSIVLEVLGVVRMSPREGTQYELSIARDAQVTGVGLLCVCSYLLYLMHGVRNVMPRPALGPSIVLEVLGVVRMSPREGTQYELSIARDAQVTGVGLLCVCSYLLYLMHGVRNVMPRPALGPSIVLEVLGVVRMSPREGTQYELSIARDAQVTGVGLLCVCSYLLYLMHGVRNVMPRPALVPPIVLKVLGVVRMSSREGTQNELRIVHDAQVTGVGLLCVCSYLLYLMHGVRNVMPRPALGPPIVLEVLGVVRMSPREGTQYELSIARDAQVTGVGLLCVCSYLLYLVHGVRNVMPRPALGPPIVLAVLGVVVFLVAVLGWQSAARLHRCRLILFSTLLVALLLVEMGIMVWSLVLRAEMLDGIAQIMDQSFATRARDNATIRNWDSLQRQLGCCGPNGPMDYRKTGAIPWSCCSEDESSSSGGDCHHVHQGGCLLKVTKFVQARLLEAAMAAVVTFLLQAGGVFCTCCLCNTIGHDNRRDRARQVSEEPYKL